MWLQILMWPVHTHGVWSHHALGVWGWTQTHLSCRWSKWNDVNKKNEAGFISHAVVCCFFHRCEWIQSNRFLGWQNILYASCSFLLLLNILVPSCLWFISMCSLQEKKQSWTDLKRSECMQLVLTTLRNVTTYGDDRIKALVGPFTTLCRYSIVFFL